MSPSSGKALARLSCLALLAALAGPARAQTSDPNAIDTGNFTAPATPDQQSLARQLASLGWIFGPETIPIGSVATIAIPAGYEMLTPPDAEKFLVLNGNAVPAADEDDYILQNEDPDSVWFAVISYESGGHIPDTDALDPAALPPAAQNSGATGASDLTVTGWAVPPAYDQASHRLEWAFAFNTTPAIRTVPLNVRLLGRTGDMKITVMDDPGAVANDVADVNKALAGLTFNQSQQYTDYTQGDATAPYGLIGLVEGASAATGALPPPAPSYTGRYVAIGAVIAVAVVLLGWLALKGRK